MKSIEEARGEGLEKLRKKLKATLSIEGKADFETLHEKKRLVTISDIIEASGLKKNEIRVEYSALEIRIYYDYVNEKKLNKDKIINGVQAGIAVIFIINNYEIPLEIRQKNKICDNALKDYIQRN